MEVEDAVVGRDGAVEGGRVSGRGGVEGWGAFEEGRAWLVVVVQDLVWFGHGAVWDWWSCAADVLVAGAGGEELEEEVEEGCECHGRVAGQHRDSVMDEA